MSSTLNLIILKISVECLKVGLDWNFCNLKIGNRFHYPHQPIKIIILIRNIVFASLFVIFLISSDFVVIYRGG
ncbi:MAG: hypothetical protein QG556_59 [Pseudomonadota bacterium]|nr:hypothetical protein [Pseudomonadota bacterium]